MSKWVAYDLAECPVRSLPDKPACYVVIAEGKVCYVGQALNLRARMTAHGVRWWRYSVSVKTPWGSFTDIKLKVHHGTRRGDWLMREYRLIHRLQPSANKRGIIAFPTRAA